MDDNCHKCGACSTEKSAFGTCETSEVKGPQRSVLHAGVHDGIAIPTAPELGFYGSDPLGF